ncbi:MAG: gamma-glutamyltransferase [Bacteroidota bacterium]
MCWFSVPGYKLWETQPNSQGIVALLALSILKNFDLTQYEHNSEEYLHLLIEAFRFYNCFFNELIGLLQCHTSFQIIPFP